MSAQPPCARAPRCLCLLTVRSTVVHSQVVHRGLHRVRGPQVRRLCAPRPGHVLSCGSAPAGGSTARSGSSSDESAHLPLNVLCAAAGQVQQVRKGRRRRAKVDFSRSRAGQPPRLAACSVRRSMGMRGARHAPCCAALCERYVQCCVRPRR